MSNKTEVIELLKDARKRVAKNWIRGALFGSQGGVCAMGGIHRAINERYSESFRQAELFKETTNALAHQIFPAAPGEDRARSQVVTRFNDRSYRTKDEVLDKFDAAIKCLENEHGYPG
jgi:hypothetical protein